MEAIGSTPNEVCRKVGAVSCMPSGHPRWGSHKICGMVGRVGEGGCRLKVKRRITWDIRFRDKNQDYPRMEVGGTLWIL